MEKEKFAIVDIGSNTMRLVIFERDQSGRMKEIENVKAAARLRNYLNEKNILEEEGILKMLDTLKSFQEVSRHHQLKHVHAVATAAIRQAVNKDDILSRANNETDFTIRLLSEYEEAYYGYLAVINSTSIQDGITIDIGGGSTEVTLFVNREMKEYHSFPFGALSLKRKFVRGELPDEKESEQLDAYILEQFQTLPWLKDRELPVIGIGGSARNLVQVDQALKEYPLAGVHQYEMSIEDIRSTLSYLTSQSFEELQRVDGLSKDRADLIIPAAMVFRALCSEVKADTFIMSRKGLRDGVFFEDLTREYGISAYPNVVEESFYEMASDFRIDLNHVIPVTNMAFDFVHLLEKQSLVSYTNKELTDLKRGAFVFNLGQYIDSESSSQHTFYLLANRTIDGMSHKERLKTALIASFAGKAELKRFLQPFQDWFTKEEQKVIRTSGAILKFMYSLNSTKRNIVESLDLSITGGVLTVHAICSADWRPEAYQAEKHKKHIEKLFRMPVELKFSYAEHV
ncbi:exopolyphosphatase [Bacillus sp. FJAT-42376]|uniref:exopolyphosphatase n=1 Tax=Bacillus sp. FJAT-42376 TaxID=2014076 RepID=UPI000F4F2DCF|nr:exopolyphosphatase [Bacillus sp. FJAT-42376]AZB42620.1 exopolyphosphatase [Bacillus sp. FJAT-42376]